MRLKNPEQPFILNKFNQTFLTLFKVLDSITAPFPGHFIDASQEKCEMF